VTKLRVKEAEDSQALRKERGAYFTPDDITAFMTNWAIRAPTDLVMEPAAGDAAFLVAAVERLRELSPDHGFIPTVYGVEIHAHSVRIARKRVEETNGIAEIVQRDFFATEPGSKYDTVVGNPPYIRYQDFSGESRALSRQAALRGGVALTGLASSWAAFTIHSAMFLKTGGRLALVLPAELLSVNYAAPVRKFLFNHFRTVQLVLFEQQVFADAEADVVLLLADGYLEGPAHSATIRQAKNASELSSLGEGLVWTPQDPAAKWTSSTIDPKALEPVNDLMRRGLFTPLETWGDTTLGIVTGNNKYFTLSPRRAKELGIKRSELLHLSPPGSSHLRLLALTETRLAQLGRAGQSTYLFYPKNPPSEEAKSYIESGHQTGVDTAYKCRVRKIWYQVPLVAVPDLFLTCMNADTPRLTANEAGARHLNSVHGVYLNAEYTQIGRELLSLASLNSVTLLHAELVGRSYGGGILKIEPKEADMWAMPSPALITERADALRAVKEGVEEYLIEGRLLDAVAVVDEVILKGHTSLTVKQIVHIREVHRELVQRRTLRGKSGNASNERS
jgi:adenine-specific DNA-methyltransferase